MELMAAVVFSIGGMICHQIPERSFYWDGQQLPVCARCAGLYLSGGLGLIGWLGLKTARGWRPIPIAPHRARRMIVFAAAPTVLTFATGVVGLWDGSNMTRALLAIPLGASAGAIVAAVFTKDLR